MCLAAAIETIASRLVTRNMDELKREAAGQGRTIS